MLEYYCHTDFKLNNKHLFKKGNTYDFEYESFGNSVFVYYNKFGLFGEQGLRFYYILPKNNDTHHFLIKDYFIKVDRKLKLKKLEEINNVKE